jgi:hypothetical protein
MRKRIIGVLLAAIVLSLSTFTAGATPAGVEFKQNGTAVIWGEAMASQGTPAAALAYVAAQLAP